MLQKDYDSPCMITSFTGSLLWALNYAHWLLSRGRGGVVIILVDAWLMPKGRVYPASFIARYLEVQPLGIRWHDDPYHEHLAFGDVPSHAILGTVGFDSVQVEDINMLLPGFNQLYRRETLHGSLSRFLRWVDAFGRPSNTANVTDDDIWVAGLVARQFLRQPDTDIHFQIAMMFLSLRKRDWNRGAWIELMNVFKGKSLQFNISCSRATYTNFIRKVFQFLPSTCIDPKPWILALKCQMLWSGSKAWNASVWNASSPTPYIGWTARCVRQAASLFNEQDAIC